MGRRKGLLSAIITVAQVLVLAVIISISHTGARAKAAGSIDITGTVNNSSGVGVSNVSVYATDPGTNNVDFGPITTGSDGSYDLQVSAGTYDFHYVPASGSGLSPIVDSDVTVLNDQPIDIQFTPATNTFSGNLSDQNGNPIANLAIGLISNGTIVAETCTDGAGNFSISAPAGVYTSFLANDYVTSNGAVCNYRPGGFGLYSFNIRGTTSGVDLTSGNVTQDLQLPKATITVTVKDSNGNPISGASLIAYPTSGSASLLPTTPNATTSFYASGGNTDSNGVIQLSIFEGLAFDQTAGVNSEQDNLCVTTSSGQTSCLSSPLTINGNTSVLFQGNNAAATPSAPTNLSAVSPTSLPSLSWDSVSGATSYNIYRNGNLIGSSTNNSYADTNAPQGSNSYYVTAVNSAGESSPSNTVSVTVIPSSPTNLTAPTPTNQHPALSWTAGSTGNNPAASYYNIYRNGTDIGSSSTTTFTDTNAPQGSNSYYVTAVSLNGVESGPSNSFTVVYDTTPPTITYTVSPSANNASWNNTPVTVTFTCSDNGTGVGIASCSAPVTLSNNGSNQKVTGTVTDNAGNTTSVTTTAINIDQSVPMVGTPTWSTNPVVTGISTTLTDSATASDTTLSPITGGEYYIGSTDPGTGHGTSMSYSSTTGNLTASLGTSPSLSPGTYTLHVRAVNAAGQWSSTVATTLTVKPSTIAPTITSANNYSIGIRQIITPSDFTVTTTGTPTATITESGALPTGLSFTDNHNGTANFTGMVAATATGTYHISITANNGTSPNATQSFTLTITNTDSAPTTIFPSTSNLTFPQGTTMSITFTATGNGKNQKIFLFSGTMPPGINLHDNKDGTATFFGTPTTKGTYTFTLEAENGDGVTYQQFVVTID